MATKVIKKKGYKPIRFNEGGLHQSLGIKAGVKIPKAKLAAAKSGKMGMKAQKQAMFMMNVLTGGKKKKKKS